jgi:hypothetical protein
MRAAPWKRRAEERGPVVDSTVARIALRGSRMWAIDLGREVGVGLGPGVDQAA